MGTTTSSECHSGTSLTRRSRRCRSSSMKTVEFDKLMKTTPESMWWTDLAAVEDALDDIDVVRGKVAAKALAFQEKAKAKVAEQEAKLAALKAEKERQKAEAAAAQLAEQEAEQSAAMQVDEAAQPEPEQKVEEKAGKGKKGKGKGKGKGAKKAVPEEEPEDPDLALNTEEGLGELFSDEESDEEAEDPKAPKATAKGKKEKTPLVIPDLPTFVPRERVVHEFCTKSKLKMKEEAKKTQR